MTQAIPLLEVVNIHKRFTGVYALRGVSLAFERGQIYHLLGENGCGKSTLIKIISGAQPPDEDRELVIEDARHEAVAARILVGGHRDCVSGLVAAAEHERGRKRRAHVGTRDACK